MPGIATLNETARNMTRKPRGIGFYQQYAMGGEVSGPPPMRGPDPQGIARYAPGGPVESIRPQARPESVPEFSAPLTSLRPQPRPEPYLNNLPEGKFFEINSMVDQRDGVEKPAINFRDGAIMFLTDVENMISNNQSASEPLVGKSTAAEVLEFLQEKNPTSQEFLNYFSSARLAEGGAVEEMELGGVVNVSGLQQSGQPLMALPMAPSQTPAMGGNNYPFQEQANLLNQAMAGNGLQGELAPGLAQYGGYLEQKYGNPQFAQKKHGFLQGVHQKEQQTFGGMGEFSQPELPSYMIGQQFFADGGEVSEEILSEYQRALIASESSGRSNVVNESGYRGLTQGGDAAISDFKAQEGLDFTNEEYINSPDLQMQFQRWYEQKTINYVMDKGLDAYIGRVIKGVPITMSSLLGMAHIGGDFGMQQFLETGGRYDPNDGKTSLSDYGRKFANMAIYGESGGENFNRVTPEDALMSMPVEQEGSLAFYRPRARPPEIEFSAPLTSLRPQARTDSEEMSSVNRPLALPEGQSMIEKYGLPGDMPQGGIMSASR